MRTQATERRLTTILAADVVGYNRLMAAHEAQMLASQEYFADGLTEDLITDLSKYPGFL